MRTPGAKAATREHGPRDNIPLITIRAANLADMRSKFSFMSGEIAGDLVGVEALAAIAAFSSG
jgi:hypothetical protein